MAVGGGIIYDREVIRMPDEKRARGAPVDARQ